MSGRRYKGWWLCPNDPPCEHGAVVHDSYDVDDPSPTCCIAGCNCGASSESPKAGTP